MKDQDITEARYHLFSLIHAIENNIDITNRLKNAKKYQAELIKKLTKGEKK